MVCLNKSKRNTTANAPIRSTIPFVGSESHLEELSVNHGDLKGGDNDRTHAEGTLRPADLLQQLGPLSLRAMIEQHGHLGQTQGSLTLKL